jgi:hypothetical protein
VSMKQRVNRKSPSIFIVEKVFKSKLKTKIHKLEFLHSLCQQRTLTKIRLKTDSTEAPSQSFE